MEMKNKIIVTAMVATILAGHVNGDVRDEIKNPATKSTTELLDRRAEIERKIREDDFGVYIGVIRWFSHAAEKKSVLKEKAMIDGELSRRAAKKAGK